MNELESAEFYDDSDPLNIFGGNCEMQRIWHRDMKDVQSQLAVIFIAVFLQLIIALEIWLRFVVS